MVAGQYGKESGYCSLVKRFEGILQLGLKLGSLNTNYTEDILSFYQDSYFQYIELFTVPESFNDTIKYWKHFSIPTVIHAPHSFAGMNLSIPEERENNKKKMQEAFRFADALKSEYIIFHSGVNGNIEETMYQLRPFIDSRCLIENKPMKGLNDEKCLGSTPDEIKYILNELQTGFCFDFGHAICTANSLKKEPLDFIKEFLSFYPRLYHFTDGDYKSEYDSHLHYGKGTFPINKLLKIIPSDEKVTNEAKHDAIDKLTDFKNDCLYLLSNTNLRNVACSDISTLYEWANDPETRSNSFSQEPISFDNHKRWFEKKLNSDSVSFFIYHSCGEDIGQVRFEINGSIANINYSINPSHRGKGYGYKMLLLAENRMLGENKKIKCFTAEVKNENIASQKIFKKLNYKESHEPDLVKFVKYI